VRKAPKAARRFREKSNAVTGLFPIPRWRGEMSTRLSRSSEKCAIISGFESKISFGVRKPNPAIRLLSVFKKLDKRF
jgi:hypothetical protein